MHENEALKLGMAEFTIEHKRRLKFNEKRVKAPIGTHYLLIETLPFNKYILNSKTQDLNTSIKTLVDAIETVRKEKIDEVFSEYSIHLIMESQMDIEGNKYEPEFEEEKATVLIQNRKYEKSKIVFPYSILDGFVEILSKFKLE